jgi:hypothetical protein
MLVLDRTTGGGRLAKEDRQAAPRRRHSFNSGPSTGSSSHLLENQQSISSRADFHQDPYHSQAEQTATSSCKANCVPRNLHKIMNMGLGWFCGISHPCYRGCWSCADMRECLQGSLERKTRFKTTNDSLSQGYSLCTALCHTRPD